MAHLPWTTTPLIIQISKVPEGLLIAQINIRKGRQTNQQWLERVAYIQTMQQINRKVSAMNRKKRRKRNASLFTECDF